MQTALNQLERGDLQATTDSGANIPECVEIDPSNSSLRFTHNPSVEKLLATARSGANIPERGETPSNNSLGFTHNPSVEKLLPTANSGTHTYLVWRNRHPHYYIC